MRIIAMKKFLLFALFAVSIVLCLSLRVVNAAEFTVTDLASYPSPNSGKIKALIVRLGYKDYPTDNSNKYYTNVNDDMLQLMFEGTEGGIGQPFNGLSDYLYKSSYGAMSMEIGEIIDIQMDDECESYYDDFPDDSSGWSQMYRSAYEIISSDEFVSKLNEKVDILDYDSDEWDGADALYIFDVAGNVWWSNIAEVGSFSGKIDIASGIKYGTQRYAYFRPQNDISLANIEFQLNTIIHETGHLLLDLSDYYEFKNYNASNDIGNIMGGGDYGGGFDYDAVSKWLMGWLTSDNVIGIEPADGETGVVELTPYDSDTAEGKKIAVFKCGSYYIAIDYCGGLNNNDINNGTRKNGFRFYLVNVNLRPREVLFKELQDGNHQLFIDGEDLEDIFGKGLDITNIQTGESASFTYLYTHKESNDRSEYETAPPLPTTEYEIDVPLPTMGISYHFTITDENNNDITDEIGIDYERFFETDYHYSVYFEDRRELYLEFDLINSEINSLIHLHDLPEGYPDQDIVLDLVNADGDVNVTSPSENVEIITTEGSPIFEVKISLEKEKTQEPTNQSEDPTQSTEETSQSTEDPTTASNETTQASDDKTKDNTETINTDNNNSTSNSGNKTNNSTTNSGNKTATTNVASGTKTQANTPATQIVASNTSNATSPQTGDKKNTGVWITIAGAAIATMGTAFALRRKKKSN